MSNNQEPDKKPGKQLKNAAILTGIGIQMGITIYLFVLLGKWLDSEYNNGDKLYIIITTLLGIVLSMYLVIKQINRIKH